MSEEEIKKLAIECGVLFDKYGDIVNMDVDQLTAYTAAVEAPLQARIDKMKSHLELYAQQQNEMPTRLRHILDDDFWELLK